MKVQKIVSLSYTENSIFCHPKTMKEFKTLQKVFIEAYENNDTSLMLISSCQLIPDKFICEDTEE